MNITIGIRKCRGNQIPFVIFTTHLFFDFNKKTKLSKKKGWLAIVVNFVFDGHQELW
jgi:hypothetical protein